eukprot:5347589-Amphidinium_carterae.1
MSAKAETQFSGVMKVQHRIAHLLEGPREYRWGNTENSIAHVVWFFPATPRGRVGRGGSLPQSLADQTTVPVALNDNVGCSPACKLSKRRQRVG